MFRNRIEAAEKLADELEKYRHKDAVILAIPRGAVPMGYILAKRLNLPLDVILTKKIGHPLNEEYAIGSVSLESFAVNENIDLDSEYIVEEIRQLRNKLREKYRMYVGDNKPLSLKGKVVILVDDGIATGHTMLASLEMIKKQNPAKIVVAVPVAPSSALEKISDMAHDVICLSIPWNFYAVGQFYEEFQPVSDEEVISLLSKSRKLKVQE